jgi:hypothetical protein
MDAIAAEDGVGAISSREPAKEGVGKGVLASVLLLGRRGSCTKEPPPHPPQEEGWHPPHPPEVFVKEADNSVCLKESLIETSFGAS